jgi:hypothetical protein
MVKRDGLSKALGIVNQWDMLEKLKWELENLQRTNGRRDQVYHAINACITADFILDWIWSAAELWKQQDYVANRIGCSITKLADFKGFARIQSLEMRACMQVSNASKHRLLRVSAPDVFAGFRTIFGLVRIDASTSISKEREILTIQVADCDVRAAEQVVEVAHRWLVELVERTSWPEIHPSNPDGFRSSPDE